MGEEEYIEESEYMIGETDCMRIFDDIRKELQKIRQEGCSKPQIIQHTPYYFSVDFGHEYKKGKNMGHYDNCRKGNCGRCGQTLDNNGECLGRCGLYDVSPVDTPLKGEREDMDNCEDYGDYEKAKGLRKAIADHRERRIPFQSLPTAEDQRDPWVTIVWIDEDQLGNKSLRSRSMRASEAQKFEFPTLAANFLVLSGKAKEVEVIPTGYSLVPKKG